MNRKSNVHTANDLKVNTNNKFVQSRSEELHSLTANGTFEVRDQEQHSRDTCVFGPRFVDEMKQDNVGVPLKSRFVVQNYGDKDACSITTKAPTVQHFTHRLIASLASSVCELSAHSRDVTRAYIQSKSPLERCKHSPTKRDKHAS